MFNVTNTRLLIKLLLLTWKELARKRTFNIMIEWMLNEHSEECFEYWGRLPMECFDLSNCMNWPGVSPLWVTNQPIALILQRGVLLMQGFYWIDVDTWLCSASLKHVLQSVGQSSQLFADTPAKNYTNVNNHCQPL